MMNTGLRSTANKRDGLYLLACLCSLFCLCSLSACGIERSPQPTQMTSVSVPTEIRPEATPSPTLEPTATVTPWQPLTEGQGLPVYLPVLSADSLSSLQVLGTWGNGIVYDMQWSPDGDWLAVSTSRYLLIIDTQQMTVEERLSTAVPLYHLVFSVDGRTLIGGGAQGQVYRYDLSEKSLQAMPLTGDFPITALARGHNRLVYLTADWMKRVTLIDLEAEAKESQLLTTMQGSQALGFSLDDEKLFTWSPVEPIKRWVLHTGEMEQEIFFGLDANHKTGLQVRFSADGRYAVVNQSWTVRVQNLEDGTTLGWFKGFNQPVLDTAIRADGGLVFTLQDARLQVWESKKSKVIADFSLSGVVEKPRMLRLSQDGTRLVVLGNVLTFFVWDEETSQLSAATQLPLTFSPSVAFRSPGMTEDQLTFALVDGTFLSLDLLSGTYTRHTSFSENKPVSAAAGGANMGIQAYADRSVIWTDLDNPQTINKIRGLSQPAVQLELAVDNGLLAAQTGQTTSGLWRLKDSSFVKKVEWDVGVEKMLFSPDERFLIVSGGGQTQLYDVLEDALWDPIPGRTLAANQEMLLLERYSINGPQLVLVSIETGSVEQEIAGQASQAVFSPDGRLLIMAGRELVFWNIAAQEIVLAWPNPSPLADLRISSDGRVLLLIHADGHVMLLGVNPSG
jgi:WD40 repeat protein